MQSTKRLPNDHTEEQQYSLNQVLPLSSRRTIFSPLPPTSFGADSPSHLRVETLLSDSSTPRHIRDGEFQFVDEDSCIGCGNCAMASPSAFKMLQSTGRARAYHQMRDKDGSISAAVQSCPVDCIKDVSFEELKLFENAR